MNPTVLFSLALPLWLAGCEALQSSGGRISLLVIVPFVFIGLLLWAVRGRAGRGRVGKRGKGFPDYDDRDEGM